MHKAPQNWHDHTLFGSRPRATKRARMTNRARNTPSDEVVQIDRKLKLQVILTNKWYGRKLNLRLLELCRDPDLATPEIASILNKEFKKNFTKGSVIGRLRELKDIQNGFRRKRYRVVGLYKFGSSLGH